MKAKFWRLLRSDLLFQWRYGFYVLYLALAVFYIAVLAVVPPAFKGKAATILIFSDPAACGLFFMGAMLLLEKSERVTRFFAVSPVPAGAYVCSKAAAFAAVSCFASLVLCLASGAGQPFLVAVAAVLASFLFTMAGIVAACRIRNLNQYLLVLVPVLLVLAGPAVCWLLLPLPGAAGLYPTVFCIRLMSGSTGGFAAGLAVYFAAAALLFAWAVKSVNRLWLSGGGVKL